MLRDLRTDSAWPDQATDDAVERTRADYNALPYGLHAHPQSAPGQLAAIAYLFGLSSPSVARSRVLEIGCAAGANLIPLAATHPDAQCVGVDLSDVQIEHGRGMADAFGLSNVEFFAADIAEMDIAAMGSFDFIICHGVYSWVPDRVQDAILAAIRQLLSPDGVAYVSYNVYPGWKDKEILREAMLMLGGTAESPHERVRNANALARVLRDVAAPNSVLGQVMAGRSFVADSSADRYLMHEELSEVNTPCYLMEFMAHATQHRLTYLADARPATMFATNYGPAVAARLLTVCGHSQLLMEQYLDFAINRPFRQTLLVHSGRASRIHYHSEDVNSQLDRGRFQRLHFAAALTCAEGVTRLDDSAQLYGDPNALNLEVDDAVGKAALDAMAERWPSTLSRAELIAAVSAHLPGAADVGGRLDAFLELLIIRGLVRFRLDPVEPGPTFTVTHPAYPGDWTFNVWHETVPTPQAQS